MNKGLGILFVALFFLGTCQLVSGEVTVAQEKTEKKTSNLTDYAGRYEADPTKIENFVFDLFVDKDELWVKPSHAVKRQLTANGADSFVDSGMGFSFKFNRDEKGVVKSLTVEGSEASAGRSVTARKLTLPAASAKGTTTLHLKGYPNARIVALAGSFNDWNQSQLLCAKEQDGWACGIDLKPGKYTYKFIIDGDWILDPDNANTEDDERGFTNSVLVVK